MNRPGTKIALFVQGDSGTLRCCLRGAGVAVFAADAQMLWGMQGVFILFELLSCAAFAAAALFLKRMPWEKEE